MDNQSKTFSGNIVDVVGKRIFKGTISVVNGKIDTIREETGNSEVFILPGLIDAHIHIESSMLIPSEFARLAVVHGTVGTVSDPHEIANVLGVRGILFMIGNGKKVPFKFHFGAPSCVPATGFETAGGRIGIEEVEQLLAMEEVGYLSEMMNFPGVLNQDPEVMAKLACARREGKPVDGHAPGIMGPEAAAYAGAGISTDHECYSFDEAVEKIACGMHVLIREGSAARNFDTLMALIDLYPENVMLCSDDKHPNDLTMGHINHLVRRAMAGGCDPMNVLRSCTFNPVRHYGMNVGLLQPGDPADFVLVDSLESFNILETYIDGLMVASAGKSLIEGVDEEPVNQFYASAITTEDIAVRSKSAKARVMQAFDGQLITGVTLETLNNENGFAVSDPERDVLKIVVKDRYNDAPPSCGFISGFGLRRGAIASSVAHDSHNIIAVGADDTSIVRAMNLLIASKGGVSLTDGNADVHLPLPFAGIMSGDNGYSVAERYNRIDQLAKELGSTLGAPFMTLSFMALLVIPALKMSDRGLFDGTVFSLTPLFAE